MSVQAVDLRHTSDALRLADAAASAVPQAGPRMLAFLTGQQAHAAAQAGDRNQALARLREAETAMDRAGSQGKTFGSYDPSSLQYHIAQVRYELGDRQASIDALQQAGRLRGPAYRRTHYATWAPSPNASSNSAISKKHAQTGTQCSTTTPQSSPADATTASRR
jgi:tetratricopeptide (TPR) repeat protein